MTEAIKLDAEKIRFDLLPPLALTELAKVYTLGAKKYPDYNWLGGMRWGRIYSALLRHLMAWWGGESYDRDDGQHHLASVMWCAATLLEYELRHIGEDDRPWKKWPATWDSRMGFSFIRERPLLAVDIDGTVADNYSLWFRWLKEKGYNVEGLTVKNIDRWHWPKEVLGMTRRQEIRMHEDIWGRWWKDIQPKEPDIAQTLAELNKYVDIIFLSIGGPKQASSKYKWLKKYGLGQYNVVILPYGATKLNMPFDFIVDDNPKTIENATKQGKMAFLYDNYHNRSANVGIRVSSMKEVLWAIKKVLNIAEADGRGTG